LSICSARTELLSRQQDGSWIWDEYQILLQTNVADNSAAILVTKVQNLPEEVRSILQIASFIGHDFPTDALVTIVYEEQDMIQIEYSFERHSKEVIACADRCGTETCSEGRSFGNHS
jgi:predicted ATPase